MTRNSAPNITLVCLHNLLRSCLIIWVGLRGIFVQQNAYNEHIISAKWGEWGHSLIALCNSWIWVVQFSLSIDTLHFVNRRSDWCYQLGHRSFTHKKQYRNSCHSPYPQTKHTLRWEESKTQGRWMQAEFYESWGACFSLIPLHFVGSRREYSLLQWWASAWSSALPTTVAMSIIQPTTVVMSCKLSFWNRCPEWPLNMRSLPLHFQCKECV